MPPFGRIFPTTTEKTRAQSIYFKDFRKSKTPAEKRMLDKPGKISPQKIVLTNISFYRVFSSGKLTGTSNSTSISTQSTP